MGEVRERRRGMRGGGGGLEECGGAMGSGVG